MGRVISIAGLLIVVVSIAMLGYQPAPATAGGLPCFLCHGFQFEGSDIAPRVAGTQLTDEQILKQIRTPRGLMPEFPEFAQAEVVRYIRSVPTGQPTKALSPQERSAALATIAAVAAARATAVLQSESSGAMVSTSTPSPPITEIATPLALPPPATPAAVNPSAPTPNSGLPLGISLIGALLLMMVGAVRMWQRR
ncbi:MAG: c-type cytochrome [Acidobacteriota bacterium]